MPHYVKMDYMTEYGCEIQDIFCGIRTVMTKLRFVKSKTAAVAVAPENGILPTESEKSGTVVIK